MLLEEDGGDVQCVEISAKKGLHIQRLMEAVLLQAELLELKAEHTGPVEATVIEANSDIRKGKVRNLFFFIYFFFFLKKTLFGKLKKKSCIFFFKKTLFEKLEKKVAFFFFFFFFEGLYFQGNFIWKTSILIKNKDNKISQGRGNSLRKKKVAFFNTFYSY